MIKGVFFDAHGVLYDRHEATTPYARRLLAQQGYPTAVSDEARAHLAALRAQASVGWIAATAYWHEFLQAHGVKVSAERDRLAARILERSHDVYEIPGARATVRVLKQRGFIVGIITDTMYPLEWKMSWLARIGVAEYVDAVACSTALGAHKPDPTIYLDALRQTSLVAVEAAFVGHDAVELDGARRVGMATVAVNYAPGTVADYYVESLRELLTLPVFQ